MILKDRKYTIILALVILGILVFVGVKWYENKMNLVDRGLADPRFPFHKYTILELARNGSVTDYVPELEVAWKNLPTRITPQETFDMYIQALKEGDIERALECCIEKEDYMEYNPDDPWRLVHYRISEQDIKYLNSIEEEGGLEKRVDDLEKVRSEIIVEISKIKKGSIGELEIKYKYQCRLSENEPCYFYFVKDLWGDWKLGDLHLF